MHTLTSTFAESRERDDSADTGAARSTYQPELSGTEIIAELRVLFATQRRAERLICRYLADLADRIAQRRDALLDPYADELHAARCFFQLGVRETRERVRVGRALRTLPRIEQAFIDGELSYSRVREVTRVAGAQTERGWLELAQTLDMRALERRVAGTCLIEGEAMSPMPAGASNDVRGAYSEPAGEPVRTHWLCPNTVRVTFELSAEAWALVERAMESVRSGGGARLGDGQALEAVARDALAAQTEDGNASDLEALPDGSHATHAEMARNVELHATQRGTSKAALADSITKPSDPVGLHATQCGTLLGSSNAALADLVAKPADTVIPESSQIASSLPPASRLRAVMGRRGGWTMDALSEASGLLAREVAATLTLMELDGMVRRQHGVFDPL